MKRYLRLTLEERYQISALKESGCSIRGIGRTLKRSASTISRELRRNSGKAYKPKQAHKKAQSKRAKVGPSKRVDDEAADLIADGLLRQWSPEQIAGRLALQGVTLSHEVIYQYIYEDYREGGCLFEYLRRSRKWRRTHKATRNFKNVGKRTYTNWIDKRPKIVDERCRLGDFERDSVLGVFRGPLLLTIVDRASRLTKICKIERINSQLTHYATVNLLKDMKVETITNDNGPEFSSYHLTEKALNANVYFNHPYSSWQRGTNENTNGLIRQFYPKGTDFNKVTNEAIQALEDALNNRPRKCLGFKTPLEVHQTMNRGVALSA